MKYKKLLFAITFSILAGVFLLGNPSSAEAAVAFRSATTTNNTTSCNTQSVTVNVPAGTVNGDVMVVGVQYGGSTQMTTPAGWTLINHVNNSFSTTQNLTTFYRVASSEPASYTWTMPSLVCWITAAGSYSGVSNSSPVDAQTIVGVTTSTSLVANAVTTTAANDMIVTIFAGYNGTSTTWTPPGGQTERVDSNNTSVRSIEMNDSTQASVGSSGTFTATASVSNYGANATIALRAAGCTGTFSANGSGVSGSLQNCTVGTTGKYTILAKGASGGGNTGLGTTGGNGASIQGDVYLTSGEVINIMVGQTGGNGTGGGGGGGSYAVKSTGTVPLVVAGGGGGGHSVNGGGGQASNNGTSSGGAGSSYGTGGAGLQTNGSLGGSAGGTGITASLSYVNGGTGGATNTGGTATGGYGGGGGAHSGCGGGCGAGGGGGYNGGDATSSNGNGGGSFNAGIAQTNTAGANSGNGSVVFTYVGGTAGPLVISPTSASVSYTTATLGGNVTSDGGSAVSGRGVCVSTSVNPAIGGTCFSTSGTTGVFTVGATSLSSATFYYYRAYATNANGTTYSENGTFTTLTQSAPTISSPTKSVTGSTTATLGGNITSGGSASIDARGVCYSVTATNASPQQGGTGVTCTPEGGTATGVFTMGITGLTTATGYSYKAYAHNSVGYAYTSADTFTTFGPPSTTTSAASSLTTTSAILNSTVNPNGGSTNVSYLWGTQAGVSCDLQPNTLAGPTGLTGTSNLSGATTQATLSSLTANTTYYFCVMATNTYGTNYGSVTSVTTNPTPGAYKMMDAGSVLGGGATDCDDTTAAPCPPTISSVGSATLTSLTITWSAGTGPTQTSYDLFWCDRTANGACTPSTQITNVTSAYVHNATITCGRTYAYSVRANNASGASADSNVVTGTTSACATGPSITAQGVSSISTTSVTFTSSVNGNGSATTITYRYGPSPTYNSGTPCTTLPSTIAGTNSGFTGAVNDSKASGAVLSANTTYFYCATANNAGGTTNGVSNNNLNSSFTTLKANGTTCSAGAECGSGFCYVDNDNDRYAPSSGTATCRASSQIAGTDCYDSNGSAFPGQTSYFTSNRGDGSFDYNCDSNYTNNMTNQTTAPGSMPSRTYCVGGPTLMYYAYSYCSNPCSPYCCGTSNACDPHYYCSSYTTAAIACGNTYTLFSSGPSYTSYYYGNTCSGGNNTNVYGYYESNSSSSTVGCR